MLDAGGRLRLLLQLGAGGRNAAERIVDLVDCPRYNRPEEQRDHSEQDGVVGKDADSTRDAVAMKPLDARAHRRRDDEGEEEQRDDDAQLPQR